MFHLFCFGFGYSAGYLADHLSKKGWKISATVRSKEKCKALKAKNIDCQVFDGLAPLEKLCGLRHATHVLLSVPPGEDGDPVFNIHCDDLAKISNCIWVGYLSTTGVYGDAGGKLVDETSPLLAQTTRGLRRVSSERLWLRASKKYDLPIHIFRLAGIYGAGRSAIDQLRKGNARRVIKQGHLFSRIHVEDIVAVIEASIDKPRPGAIYNVCDDEPAMNSDVVKYAAFLMDAKLPPAIPFNDESLSEMVRSFYSEHRRVDNSLIKCELGIKFKFPNYRLGLKAIKSYKIPF